ncbi:MAG: hypothetical protein ACPHL6_06180, partial [Rubripirellula sp.]
MANPSWHLSRRELLKGAGVSLGLPSLLAMDSGNVSANTIATEQPKRLMIGYIAYGTYMPEGASGIPNSSATDTPHHPWSWWPCREAGELTFNQSAEPFKELKPYVSYLRGL